MSIFNDLQPVAMWNYFEEILKIPRPSKREDKIITYLKDFAAKHNLSCKLDKVGNLLISKPATSGYENVKSVVLQGHLDMVCEKNNDVEHDFDKDPINAYIEDGWVKSVGTTLGGDDGIGIAASMAILASEEIKHGPIECLFTIDEESGMSGAIGLEENFLKSEILLNLDSEDEGELFIGCAGGIDTVAKFKYRKKRVPEGHIAFKISVTGLKGGHSGDEIDKGYGNSNKVITKILWQLDKKVKFRLADFDGGNLRNAIPREAFAIFTTKRENRAIVKNVFEKVSSEIIERIKILETEIDIKLEVAEQPYFVINKKVQDNLINALYACPHGVYVMSKEIPGFVQTSTNMASVKFKENNIIEVVTSQRSSVESSKYDIAYKVESVFLLAYAEVTHSEGYPGWKPNTNSEILKISEKSYLKLFNKKPLVKVIHAGLECGLFSTKYPKLDMISFGPTIKGAHSPDERMNIQTVKMFWDLLVEILENIPKK